MRLKRNQQQKTKNPFNTQTKKSLIIITTLLVISNLIISIPTLNQPKPPPTDNTEKWSSWAETAWTYFQPNIGVNNNTGLPYTNTQTQTCNDQDIGMYLTATINAQRLELTPKNDPWGSDDRIEKILTFLETRPTTNQTLPYAKYDTQTQTPPPNTENQTATPQQVAFLLTALDDLKNFNPTLTQRINTITNRYNLQTLAQNDAFTTNDLSTQNLAQAYQTFGYTTPKPTDPNQNNDPTTQTQPNNTPQTWTNLEPLILAILKEKTNAPNQTTITKIFPTQQEDYEKTGKLTALIFHAAYNNSTQTLFAKINALATQNGFYEGTQENNQPNTTTTANTNAIVLQAAYYHNFFKPTLITLSPTTFPRYAITTFALSPEHIDEQLQLLKDIGAYNITIVNRESTPDKFQTVYNAAKNISTCIIPELSYMQTLTPTQREGVIDARFNLFQQANSTNPKGIFSFQIDTYTANYLKTKYNQTFAIANIWDQINIDFMSLRGSPPTPYYANQQNNLIPAQTQNQASLLVLTPFATAPTDTYHYNNNHIIDLYTQGNDIQTFKYTSKNNPFFTPLFTELDWILHLNSTDLTNIFIEQYKWIYANFNVVTAEQFTTLFQTQFPTTPEYHFIYTSSNTTNFPETKNWKIEWLINPNTRIAKLNNTIISAIDYNNQKQDPYLTTNKPINFTSYRFGEDPNNIITTDLTFTIDCLWQKQYGDRTLTQKNPTPYTNNLKNYPPQNP